MDEELDYMSDEFLNNCTDAAGDVRPGLIKSHKEKREHELLKKRKLNIDSQKKLNEAEVLEESLKQPINSSNKGFSMLRKMGFKTGMGLGKNNTGIVEPIGINIKKDRKGLGLVKKPKINKNVPEVSEDEFRAFLCKKNKEREVQSDLKRSQKICEELDLKCDKSEPEEPWFWPNSREEGEEGSLKDDSEDKVEVNDSEKLETLTRYLRDRYYYCIWCKVQYNDEKDMEDCPGATRDDH